MKRKLVFVSIFMAMTIFCVSCGTRLPEAGDYTAEDSASEGAVKAGKRESINDIYPYCNDVNLYTIRETKKDAKIRQCKLDGTVVREYTLAGKNSKYTELSYVNNEEIFYTEVDDENGTGTSDRNLYRIPIEKRTDGDRLQMDKAEKVLTDEKGVGSMYANEDYIAYITNENCEYREYDRKKKRFLSVSVSGGKTLCAMNNYLNYGFDYGIAGDTVLLTEYEDEKSNKLATQGLYVHKLGTEQFTEIETADSWYVSSDSYMCSSMRGNKICYNGGRKGSYNAEPTEDILIYDTETKEKQTLISTKQLRQYCSTEEFVVWRLQIWEDRLYVFVETYKDDDDIDGSWLVLSRALNGKAELRCEKKLTKLLNSLDNFKEDDGDVYWIDEESIDIVEGKVIVEYGSTSQYHKCYDLSDGTCKDVKQGDAEAAYWDYRTIPYWSE